METGRYSSHNLSIEHFTAIQANTEVDPQRETIHRWLSAPDPSPNHIALVGEDIRLYVDFRLTPSWKGGESNQRYSGKLRTRWLIRLTGCKFSNSRSLALGKIGLATMAKGNRCNYPDSFMKKTFSLVNSQVPMGCMPARCIGELSRSSYASKSSGFFAKDTG